MKIKKKIAELKQNIKDAPLAYYVALSLTMIVLYVIAERIMTAFGLPPMESEISVGWYSVWGGELLILCVIKLFKLKEDKEDGDSN